MDVVREEIGLPSPASSPKANSTSHGDEVRPTEAAGDKILAVDHSGSVYKKATASRH